MIILTLFWSNNLIFETLQSDVKNWTFIISLNRERKQMRQHSFPTLFFSRTFFCLSTFLTSIHYVSIDLIHLFFLLKI